MTRRALTAIAALLLLSACGGGGGGGMSQGQGPGPGPAPTPSPTVAGVQTTDPNRTLGAAGRVGDNLPAFGSVTQSTNGGSVSGITSDAASTTFDGRNIDLTVRRADGSRLRLNSASHLEDSLSIAADIPGHDTLRGDVLLDYSNTQGAAAVVYVSWDNDDPTDYLAGGYWLHATGNFNTATVTGIEIGAFVDGPELDTAATVPVSGSASYQGPTEGMYASRTGSDVAGVSRGSIEIGGFNGVIDLTANFGTSTISGCVGCTGPVETYGIFTDAATGQTFDVEDSSDVILRFGPAPIGQDGSFRNRRVSATLPGFTVTSTTGSWGGKLSSTADAAGDPRLVAGTYGGRSTTSGGSEAVYVGAYHANKR